MMALEVLARLAASKAALDLGLVRQLWEVPLTAAELAGRTGCARRGLERVLDVLATTELLVRDGDRYGLAPALRDELIAAPGGFERTLALFEHVARFARTGEPVAAMDGTDHQRAAAYQELVGGLGEMWERAAEDVARAIAPVTGTIVDLGAGSGVWSLAIAARSPEARVVAIDFGPVLARFAERAARLGFADRASAIECSWFEVALPAADLAVLANVLHLERAAGARRLLARIAEVAPRIAIIDVLDGPDAAARSRHAAYSLHLAARTRAGTAHRRDAIVGCSTSSATRSIARSRRAPPRRRLRV
jgi:hypothetical protein